MKSHYDVIIVGAGSMGMSAGYYLTQAGAHVLLIDAFDPPHSLGSHHGDTRMIRHAYGEGSTYVPLALKADQLWRELEHESGKKLYHQTGVLGVGHKDSPFLAEELSSAKQFSLPLEILEAKEVQERWPGISIPDAFVGLLEPTSGLLLSEDAILTYRQLALQNGAILLTHTPVNQIYYHQEGVSVQTEKGAFHAEHLIITAGAWIGKLLSSLALPIQPIRKTVAWFEADPTLYDYTRFPSFFFDLPNERYYGFPSIEGSGIKVGRQDFGQPTDPDMVNRQFGAYETDEGDVRRFLQSFMPSAAGKLIQGGVCLITKTPDEAFILDSHPEYPHVTIASICSAHGFKFASVIGQILCQKVMQAETGFDLTPFSLKRFE